MKEGMRPWGTYHFNLLSHPAALVGQRCKGDFRIFGANKGYRKNGGLDYLVSIRCLHLF